MEVHPVVGDAGTALTCSTAELPNPATLGLPAGPMYISGRHKTCSLCCRSWYLWQISMGFLIS